ncbi:MAG: response regulator [Desulfobacterales bacterium]|nr:response regulator [Desulfobacterales bacterium]
MLIFVVDDDPDQVESICTGLRTRGYTTLSATTPDRILGLLTAHAKEIDLLITDYAMPGMDGLELLKTVKAAHTIPVLMISAHMKEKIREEFFRWGGDGFLEKPFTRKTLISEIHRITRAKKPEHR